MRSGLRLVSWVLALAVAISAAYAADRPSTERRGPAPGHDASTTRALMGRVVRSGANVVYLEHMGAVVAFRITRGTQFTGLGAKASGDLVEGQQVLATFTVQDGVTNVAKKIAATSEATGEPRSSSSPGPTGPALPPDGPRAPERRSTVPPVPPDEGIPRDPGVPRPTTR